MAMLYVCPECGRRGVTYNKARKHGRFRCRHCGHYPGWIRPPVGADQLDEKTMSEECFCYNPNPGRGFRLRDMLKYCAEKGIEPPELTNEEVEQFYYDE